MNDSEPNVTSNGATTAIGKPGKAIVIEENSRVKRKAGGSACAGVVRSIREESRPSKIGDDEKALLVTVLWDNGTFSYVAPEALEVVVAQ